MEEIKTTRARPKVSKNKRGKEEVVTVGRAAGPVNFVDQLRTK